MSQRSSKDNVSFESQDTQCPTASNRYSFSTEDEIPQQSLHTLDDLDDGYETSDSDLTDLESIDTPSDFETTDSDTPRSCSSTPCRRGPQRLPTMPYSRQKIRSKLARVVKTLQRSSWGMEAFIEAWVQSPDILTHRRYSTPAKRRKVLYSALSKAGVFDSTQRYIGLKDLKDVRSR
ncbi:hypothetical protein ACJ73_02305 [Blastomyces percursus]|uniref:Uncharacterized protein n=1 Tax=Blastomyces percursus TaxID=1658174 RepID=A0A1J9RCQ2_9EURO|nr:hypothetical protein ACJ73_02305 [Blastomyces percursus]